MDFATRTQLARGPAADVWRRQLSQIPTLFGRLVYLASMRDENTGRYSHEILVRLQGPEEADRTLRHSHQQVFSQWIASSLADQKADLDGYMSEVGGRTQSLWRYRNVVPTLIRDVERQLYLTDFETLLLLLQFEHDAASPLPRA
jgi:hypothetical protein